MSIFASQSVSDPIAMPFDPPHTVTVRNLTGRDIEAAQEAHRTTLASGSARSWAVTFRRAIEKGASDPDVLNAIRDPLTGYDRYALVRSGLVSWSYDRPIGPEAIDDLDDEAVDFIATEILRRTKPALFHATEEAALAEKKSDWAPSTVT